CEPFLRLDRQSGAFVMPDDPAETMCLAQRPMKGLDGSCPACPVPSCGGCAPTCCGNPGCCITDHDTGNNCCSLPGGGDVVCSGGKPIHYTTGPCGDGPPQCPASGIQDVFCE